MEQITRRHFTFNRHKYLKPGKYLITRHGSPELVITICKYEATQEEPTYACGCELGKSKLCPKHGRA